MKKVTSLVLMLCLALSGALCYAHGEARTESKKGEDTPVLTIVKSQHGGTDKSGSVLSSIYGHVLSVVFSENLGQVAVEITTASGVPVENLWTYTPNGIQTYLSLAGDYINVYQLEWDCDRDELITCQTDLTSFDYKVKKSIAITSTNGDVSVGSSNKVTFRTSGFFEITGPFQVDSGGELTVIMQSCPE